MNAVPLTLTAAKQLVTDWHRHHKAPVGGLFAIGAEDNGKLVGAVIIGRPVARMLQDGFTAEVTRCVTDGTPNACSFLYAAAWRAARAMGYTRLITYTLAAEPGTSLVAGGWKALYQTKDRPKGWDTPSRPRTSGEQVSKILWEKVA